MLPTLSSRRDAGKTVLGHLSSSPAPSHVRPAGSHPTIEVLHPQLLGTVAFPRHLQ